MATVRFNIRRSVKPDSSAPAQGYVRFVSTERHTENGVPRAMILPESFQVRVPKSGIFEVDLEPTGSDWVWEVHGVGFNSTDWVEHVTVPSTSTHVDFADLPRASIGGSGPAADDEAWLRELDQQIQTAHVDENGDLYLIRRNGFRALAGKVVGPKGDKGDPGKQGPDGAKGAKGDPGVQGERGPEGAQGLQGQRGVQGIQGIPGIPGVQGVQGPKGDKGDGFEIVKVYPSIPAMNADFNNPAVKEGDFVSIATADPEHIENAQIFVKGSVQYEFLVDLSGAPGAKGDKGDEGPQGAPGAQGPQGERGQQGEPGPQGDRGPKGLQGLQGIAGPQGIDGQDGKSAYQVWLDAGNTGTESEYLESLKGERGAQGIQGQQGLQGPQGIRGFGVPTGGLPGQVLTKTGPGDTDTSWRGQRVTVSGICDYGSPLKATFGSFRVNVRIDVSGGSARIELRPAVAGASFPADYGSVGSGNNDGEAAVSRFRRASTVSDTHTNNISPTANYCRFTVGRGGGSPELWSGTCLVPKAGYSYFTVERII